MQLRHKNFKNQQDMGLFLREEALFQMDASWFPPKLVGVSKSLELATQVILYLLRRDWKMGLINYLIDDEENIIDVGIQLAKMTETHLKSVAATRHMLWVTHLK